MTWYWTVDGQTLTVWDHTETEVVSGYGFSGSWMGDYPDAVLDVMRQEADQSGAPTAYNQQLLLDAATENIERGQPGGGQ